MIDILKFVARTVLAGCCSCLLLWGLLVAHFHWTEGMGLAHSYLPIPIFLIGLCFFFWALGFVKFLSFKSGNNSDRR
jgi:hypothetical protein